MKKAKRKQRFFIAAALIATMMIQPFTAFAADDAVNQAQESSDNVTVLWDEDFDSIDKSHEPFSRSNNTEITKYDDTNGKSAKISCLEGTWPEFVKAFDEPIGDGVLYVGYDILGNPYSTTVAQKKVEKNAARMLSDDVSLRIGAYFHSALTQNKNTDKK